ncbi:glycoside hydrolase family 3 protein [Parafrankia discariae]|uniref:glycoside hydrolase family 3 protein n=1 Tax=Parafrankia discariae TaxID=365528 RepID=UPI00036342EC|nr:glycoside hydrolase family 3 protein [Parafrankia discariae]
MVMRRARVVGVTLAVVLAVLAGVTAFAWAVRGTDPGGSMADRLGLADGDTADGTAGAGDPRGGASGAAGAESGRGTAEHPADGPGAGADQLSAADPGGAGNGPGTGSAEETSWVESTLAGLSLEQRVGQMMTGYVFGTAGADRSPAVVAANRRTSGADTAAEAVAKRGLGGVIYFDAGGTGPGALPDNIVNPGQVKALSADLSAAARVPLLIAADQEQGTVLRIRDGVTLLPGQMAQGATGRPDDARDAAQITGADLRALGINVDFAPDADVNSDPANPVIGERSFGDDPAAVGRFTAAAVEGFRQVGVAAAAKHFPGHGATSVDSHADLPTISRDRAALTALDLPPFRAAIAAGVPMVMVGHLNVPALDPAAPATLSKPVVDGLLRHELGFDGVIVTDALNMAAITEHNTPGGAAVRAVQAGVDILLMPPDLVQAVDAVVSAVRSGAIDPERVAASVRRILRMKWRLAHTTPVATRTSGEAEATAAAIAGRAITLLDQPTCDLLPLIRGTAGAGTGGAGSTGSGTAGAGADGAPPTVEVSGPSGAAKTLVDALTARGIDARLTTQGAGRAPAPPAAGAPGAGTSVVRVVLVGNSPPPVTDRRTVIVSTGTPYRPPVAAGAWLASYSRDPASMRALAAVLAGAAPPAGRLPVVTRTAAGTALPRGAGLPAPRAC